MLKLSIHYDDGDVCTTRFNGTPDEAIAYYPVGQYHNVGDGPHDHYARIVRMALLDNGISVRTLARLHRQYGYIAPCGDGGVIDELAGVSA